MELLQAKHIVINNTGHEQQILYWVHRALEGTLNSKNVHKTAFFFSSKMNL